MECIEYHDTHCVNYSTESNHSYCFDEENQNNNSNEVYDNDNANDNFIITKTLDIEVSKNQTQDNINTLNKTLNNNCLEKQSYSINSKVIDITCIHNDEDHPEPNHNNVHEEILNKNNNDNSSNNVCLNENEKFPISKILNLPKNKPIQPTHNKSSSIVVKKLPNININRISKVPLTKHILYNKIINQQQNPFNLFHHKVFDNNYNSPLSIENISKNRATSALTKSSKRTTSACSITARDKSNDNKRNNNNTHHHQLNRIKSATMLLLKDNSALLINEIKQKPNMNINNNNNHIQQEQEYQRYGGMKSNLYFNLANFTKMKNVWNVHTLNTNNKLTFQKKEYKKIIFGLDNNNNNNGKNKDVKGNKYVLRKSKSISECKEMSVNCKEKENMKKDNEPQSECVNNKREENVNKNKKVLKKKKMC